METKPALTVSAGFFVYRWRDSNPQHLVPKTSALSLELQRRGLNFYFTRIGAGWGAQLLLPARFEAVGVGLQAGVDDAADEVGGEGFVEREVQG